MEYVLIAAGLTTLLSMVIWSITGLLCEVRKWVDRVQDQAWLLMEAEKHKKPKL